MTVRARNYELRWWRNWNLVRKPIKATCYINAFDGSFSPAERVTTQDTNYVAERRFGFVSLRASPNPLAVHGVLAAHKFNIGRPT
jgi:hypothetical protein